ncbi:MAG: hypothetical protein LBD11_08365 [Candidatus Peribacteria bacterium]|jgi:hypothetical protein|nr:hypothetical protein [Candidatus Peribacteria bacterium]
MSLTLNQAEIKFIKELREKVINFLPTPERELTTLEKYVEYTEEHIIIHDPVCGDITMMNKNLWSEVVGI